MPVTYDNVWNSSNKQKLAFTSELLSSATKIDTDIGAIIDHTNQDFPLALITFIRFLVKKQEANNQGWQRASLLLDETSQDGSFTPSWIPNISVNKRVAKSGDKLPKQNPSQKGNNNPEIAVYLSFSDCT